MLYLGILHVVGCIPQDSIKCLFQSTCICTCNSLIFGMITGKAIFEIFLVKLNMGYGCKFIISNMVDTTRFRLQDFYSPTGQKPTLGSKSLGSVLPAGGPGAPVLLSSGLEGCALPPKLQIEIRAAV